MQTKQKWQILLFIIGISFILVDPPMRATPSRLTDFFVLFSSVIIESLPFLVLGSLLAAVIHVYIPADRLLRILPRQLGLRLASILGIGFVFPVCECGNVPLSRSLIRKGLSTADAIMLLVAAPILNPVTITTTYQAFKGQPGIVVGRIAGGLACALVVRHFVGRFSSKQLLTPQFAASCQATPHDHQHHQSRFGKLAQSFTTDLMSLFPSLLLGAGLAATLQVAVPRAALLSVAATPLLAILIMLVLAFVISICANVDAFFALALAGLFPPSAILAFLILGPIVDLKMLSLMRTTFSRFTIISICCLVLVVTLVFSLGMQYVF